MKKKDLQSTRDVAAGNTGARSPWQLCSAAACCCWRRRRVNQVRVPFKRWSDHWQVGVEPEVDGSTSTWFSSMNLLCQLLTHSMNRRVSPLPGGRAGQAAPLQQNTARSSPSIKRLSVVNEALRFFSDPVRNVGQRTLRRFSNGSVSRSGRISGLRGVVSRSWVTPLTDTDANLATTKRDEQAGRRGKKNAG